MGRGVRLGVGTFHGGPDIGLVGVMLVQVALQRAEVTAAVDTALLVGHGDAQVHAAAGTCGRRRALEQWPRRVRMLRWGGGQRTRDARARGGCGGSRGDQAARRAAWGPWLRRLLLGTGRSQGQRVV